MLIKTVFYKGYDVINQSVPYLACRQQKLLQQWLNLLPDNIDFFGSSALLATLFPNELKINVNPLQINSWLPSSLPEPKARQFRHYFTSSLALTQYERLLSSHRLHQEALVIFEYRDQYKQSAYYQKMRSQLLNQGGFFHNKVNIKDEKILSSYFARYVQLLNQIESQGFLRQAELKRQPVKTQLPSRSWYLEKMEEDVGIAINAHGKLVRFRGGFHRFAFAQQCSMRSIPIQIKFIHAQWLNKFDHYDCLQQQLAAAVDSASNGIY